MTTIYTVMGCVDHEGSAPIKSFYDKQDALSFIDLCEQYDLLRPETVHYDDGEINYQMTLVKMDTFKSNHPAKIDDFDYYHIVPTELL